MLVGCAQEFVCRKQMTPPATPLHFSSAKPSSRKLQAQVKERTLTHGHAVMIFCLCFSLLSFVPIYHERPTEHTWTLMAELQLCNFQKVGRKNAGGFRGPTGTCLPVSLQPSNFNCDSVWT